MGNNYLVGLSEELIPTPSLVLDVEKFENNIKKMNSYLVSKGVNLRAHSKTHKTPMIAHQQIKSGAIGICCATVGEAEVMVSSGVDNILIANEVVGEDKIRRVVNLARYANVMVAVDNAKNIDDLSSAAKIVNISLGVLIEIDVGMGRCGVRTIDEAVLLAKKINETDNIELKGIMGYEGHAVFIIDKEERIEAGRLANSKLVNAADAIRKEGIKVEIVSCAGTGTFNIAGEFPGITEIQAGSYIFMDLTYEKVGLPFEQSLFVLASVVSCPDDETVILDSGMKCISVERECPRIVEYENLEVLSLAEEHAKCHLNSKIHCPKPNDKVHLVMSHCCSTINLHDKIYVVRNGLIEGIWTIAARGAH